MRLFGAKRANIDAHTRTVVFAVFLLITADAPPKSAACWCVMWNVVTRCDCQRWDLSKDRGRQLPVTRLCVEFIFTRCVAITVPSGKRKKERSSRDAEWRQVVDEFDYSVSENLRKRYQLDNWELGHNHSWFFEVTVWQCMVDSRIWDDNLTKQEVQWQDQQSCGLFWFPMFPRCFVYLSTYHFSCIWARLSFPFGCIRSLCCHAPSP